MGGFKEELAGAIASSRRKAASKKGLKLCKILDEGIGLKVCLHEPLDAGIRCGGQV